MALTSFKLSLKRQRSNNVDNDPRSTMEQQKIGCFDHVIITKSGIRAGYDCLQSICERTACSVSRPSRSNNKRCRGRLIRNHMLSFLDILVAFAIFFLSSGSAYRFVNGQLERRQLFRDENPYLLIRSNLNRMWKKGEQEGSDTFLNYDGGKDISQEGSDTLLNYDGGKDIAVTYSKQTQEGSYREKKGRELSGELEKFIRQQNATNITDEILPTVRRNTRDSSQPPSETNVVSTPSATLSPATLLDIGGSVKKGNPLILNIVEIKFSVKLEVRDMVVNQLLTRLEMAFEEHIQSEYQELIDRSRIGRKNTLKLGVVDLTLSLVESRWQERRWRRLDYNSNIPVRASPRLRHRNMQGGKSSNTKIMTISVNGSVNYSMEVDGSLPTPDDIERQWSEAYMAIASQDQLQRVIQDAQIEGVVRLEQVTNEDADITNSAGDGSDNGDENGTSNNDDIASLYDNDSTESTNESSENDTQINENEDVVETSKKSKKGAPLERPSTLSIIFGFILTGIAILGLFGYAYLFYRKRKKYLNKKKKMKESITFSSASAAAAAATGTTTSAVVASNRNQNSLYYSKNAIQSIPPTQHSSQAYLNSMVLSQTESEETTYRGLESSIGSEDASDPFANELKLAASLDQEAWDEIQRKKEILEERQVAQIGSYDPTVRKNRNPIMNPKVPSLLSKGALNLEEKDEVEADAIEAGLKGNTAWVQSFPYGDEDQRVGDGNHDESNIPSYSKKWEPYNSALPPLVEEKKDESSPSEFFAQKLNNIEKDLTISRGKPVERSRIEPSMSDDVSDILSEVSEISRYVRRYERRKDRKFKREEDLHERLGATNGAPSHPPVIKPISIGMDRRIHNAESDKYDRPTPSPNKRLEPYPLSSYAGSFRDAQKQEAMQESFSVVSDEAGDAEDKSLRSQRLGISPYSRSKDEVYYQNGKLRNQEDLSSNRTRTTSSRTRSARIEDDYRYTVGYTQDSNKSSSSRLADLRANDAIIDNSNSEVNVSYGVSQIPRANNQNSLLVVNEGSGMAENTKPVISAANKQQSYKPRPPATKNRFAKLRGIFEQKTNEQPAPIYPPGANWQNAGSFGK